MRKMRGLVPVLALSLVAPAFSVSQEPLFTFIGPPVESLEGRWGNRISPAGDVNGDGYADILVAGHLYRDWEHTDDVYLYLGSAGGIVADKPIHVVSFDPLNEDTTSIAPAGDVDGDGYDDILIGAPFLDTPAPGGNTILFRGSPTGLEQPAAWSVSPDFFTGLHLSPAGDVNRDGYADVVLSGSYMAEGAQYASQGGLLYLGSETGLALTPASIVSYDQDQMSFAEGFAAGDVNRDGYSDLVVYAERGSWTNGEGQKKVLFLYYGGPNGYESEPAWTLNDFGEPEYPLSYCSIALGDVNGDGNPDLLFGAPLWAAPGSNSAYEGKIFLFYGNGKGFSTLADWSFRSEWPGSYFGETVAVADVNGDGYGDILAGGGQFGMDFVGAAAEEKTGGVFFFPGSREGVGKNPAWVDQGGPEDFYGRVMAAVGDVNGDGKADFASTAFSYNPGGVSDKVKVQYGFKETKNDNFWLVPPLCFLETLGAER